MRASMSDTLRPLAGPFSLSLVMVSALSVPFFFCKATAPHHRQPCFHTDACTARLSAVCFPAMQTSEQELSWTFVQGEILAFCAWVNNVLSACGLSSSLEALRVYKVQADSLYAFQQRRVMGAHTPVRNPIPAVEPCHLHEA